MISIDKQALREAAEKATKGEWADWFDDEVYSTNGVENQQVAIAFNKNDMRDAAFIAAANPITVLALLDELEPMALAHLNLNLLCDVYRSAYEEARHDGLVNWEAASSLAEENEDLKRKLQAAEKRIAELERKEQHIERQSVIDGLAASGESWSDIEEYMQRWDAEHAAAAGKGDES